MIRRLTTQLPPWARTSHPVLRYELGKQRQTTRTRRILNALVIVVGLAVLYGGGYLLATNFGQQAAGQNLTEEVANIVFWPTLILQVFLRIGALTLTAGAVSEEKRRQTWDNLRATQSGAELALRTRWAAVFYRLRLPLTIVTLVRIILIAGILYDLTAFQGRYLDLIINGVIPETPLFLAAILLALLMTASLLLPLTGLGFDAALGLLISTGAQQRTYSAILQILVVLIRVALVIGLVYAADQFRLGLLPVQDGLSLVLMLAFAAIGDWGLAFLHLGFYGEIWATVPYGIFLGLGLLIFSMIQAALTDWILALAIRRAERKG
jgi:hypothetical protein